MLPLSSQLNEIAEVFADSLYRMEGQQRKWVLKI